MLKLYNVALLQRALHPPLNDAPARDYKKAVDNNEFAL